MLTDIEEIVPASNWTSDISVARDFMIRVSSKPGQRSKKKAGIQCNCLDAFECAVGTAADSDDEEDERQVAITAPRNYYLRAQDVAERNQWMRALRKAVKKAKERQARLDSQSS
eukprot:CAMPEP_0206272416 /NCGR_PEP_ID=MMETSP0047_2-20121206/33995_1 /ASSEMBLY_ACC=CAM_ASM_000192 /TAXON_ID=195065 /ORGANISM="Chroomonas mesostigmatica_cf, Strain CCMP1168" /LENGTH=113 /DNA_ID=CAMNT_0053701333 /DNA_START=32 /DNA_END=370 /DNA_ORIENTATION=+